MHRFYLPLAKASDTALVLNESEAHHAVSVLRVRQGERVSVLNGRGDRLMCEVAGTAKRSVDLKVVEYQTSPPPRYKLTLVQAITKGKSMDLIVQKATELGVSEIIPIQSEHTVAHVEDDRTESKTAKWQVTAVEALKQCGSAWMPKIHAPVDLRELLSGSIRFDLSLITTLQNNALHPRLFFDTFRAEHQHPPETVAVWVGPEGDFSPAEIESILSSGAKPITLGDLTLRSETAAICALSILNYELQFSAPPLLT